MTGQLLLLSFALSLSDPLIAGLGHDRQTVRRHSEAALSLLNMRLNLQGRLNRAYEDSRDPEVRKRLRRVMADYESVWPSVPGAEDYLPMIYSVSLREKDFALVDYDKARDLHMTHAAQADGCGYYKPANKNLFHRWTTREYCSDLIRSGATRWEVQRVLDRAVKREMADRQWPVVKVFVLEPE